MKKFWNCISGVVLGALAGIVAVALFTPKSGPDMRTAIKEKKDEIKNTFNDGAEEKRHELEDDLNSRRGTL